MSVTIIKLTNSCVIIISDGSIDKAVEGGRITVTKADECCLIVDCVAVLAFGDNK